MVRATAAVLRCATVTTVCRLSLPPLPPAALLEEMIREPFSRSSLIPTNVMMCILCCCWGLHPHLWSRILRDWRMFVLMMMMVIEPACPGTTLDGVQRVTLYYYYPTAVTKKVHTLTKKALGIFWAKIAHLKSHLMTLSFGFPTYMKCFYWPQLWPLVSLRFSNQKQSLVPHMKDLLHIYLEPKGQGFWITFKAFHLC